MKMLVPIILGSPKDQPWADKIMAELDKWDIPHEVKVASAHKVPELLIEIVRQYNAFEGLLCYVTVAGRSNGLSGCTAGSSIHPVIACPPFKDKEDMIVNLNSTVQMPSETPVLTVLDPNNAANCIVRMFALSDGELKKRYEKHIQDIKASFTTE